MTVLDRSDVRLENFLFRNFVHLNDNELRLILSFRNHDDVRRWMFSTDLISEEDHFYFIQSLLKKKNDYYWAVYKKNNLLAVVYLNKWDANKKSGYWGFYLNPKYIGTGKGLDVQFFAMKLFFSNFGLNFIHGQVKCDNWDSLSIQEVFNFSILSNESELWYNLELKKEDWEKLPNNLVYFKKRALEKWKRKF